MAAYSQLPTTADAPAPDHASLRSLMPALARSKVLTPAFRMLLVRSASWLAILGLPVIIALALTGNSPAPGGIFGFLHLFGYLILFSLGTVSFAASLYAIPTVLGACAATIIFTTWMIIGGVGSGMWAAIKSEDGVEPFDYFWIPILLLVGTTLIVVVRLLIMSFYQVDEAWTEGETHHERQPATEPIVEALSTTSQMELKRRRRLLEVAVAQNLATLNHLRNRDSAEYGDAAAVVDEILKQDLRALGKVSRCYKERFGEKEHKASEGV